MNEELGIMNGGICHPCLKRGDASFIRHSSFIIPRFREGFTLVEMLIVVAILAVLMTIVFKLGSLGGSDSRRTTTVVRLQKIENCLSGYYAAFGSYPPVKVHGWADIDHDVDANGDQTDSAGGGSANQNESGSSLVWNRVNAACRSQPFGCEYPPSVSAAGGELSEQEIIENWVEEVKARCNNSSDYPQYAPDKWNFANLFQGTAIRGPNVQEGGFVAQKDNPSWKAIKLFKFGVMSYLLPRYLFMMGGEQKCFGVGTSDGEPFAQWGDNNDMPCNPLEGKQYDEWQEVIEYAQYGKSDRDIQRNDLAKVANIPSQAVCARWMPNLEGMCSTLKAMKFFGINVSGSTGLSAGWESSDGEVYPPAPCTHYPPGSQGTPYRNASVTIVDGWWNEFYYYSPPPYQTYTLWSAGPNGKTFPPWMALDELSPNDRETAQNWKNDDIMQMSH